MNWELMSLLKKLLSCYTSLAPRRGVIAGFIDDLYWAASFSKAIEVINFVMLKGPECGYRLNMKNAFI